MDSDQIKQIGSAKLDAHLLSRTEGIPSGPGAESSLSSEIASHYNVTKYLFRLEEAMVAKRRQ